MPQGQNITKKGDRYKMIQPINEQTQDLSTIMPTEEVEKEVTETKEQTVQKELDKQEVSLGRFKDINALLSAYNSLQAEFTKRCQRIKELESANAVDKENNPQPTLVKQEEDEKIDTTLKEEEILKEYLKNLVNSKQKAVVLDGVGVGIKTPVTKPKTISEAGQLFSEILSENNK